MKERPNPFIAELARDNDYSVARLKQLFRLASKKTHPDLAGLGRSAFIRVKSDFDEALRLIEDGAYGPSKTRTREKARIDLLKNLYLFGLKVFTKRADALIRLMIEAAEEYEPAVAALLRRYELEIYADRSAWRTTASIYYTHGIFIAGIRLLFQYYNTGSTLHRRLLDEYERAMTGWSSGIPAAYSEILKSLYAWLIEEADKEPFEYYG